MRDPEVRAKIKDVHFYVPGVCLGDLSADQDPKDYDNMYIHLPAYDNISNWYDRQSKPLDHVIHENWKVGTFIPTVHSSGNYVRYSYTDAFDLPRSVMIYDDPML